MSLLLDVWGCVDRFQSDKSGTRNGVRMYSTAQIQKEAWVSWLNLSQWKKVASAMG